MDEEPGHDLTNLLNRMRQGDPAAREGVVAVFYSQLRQRAQALVRCNGADYSVQATILVNDAVMKLLKPRDLPWMDRGHFLRSAARAMRQVLVDHRRKNKRQKRCADGLRVPLEDILEGYEDQIKDMILFDEVLECLAQFDPKMAEAVDLRFFAGLSVEETAAVLGLPKSTFEKHWKAACTWISTKIDEN